MLKENDEMAFNKNSKNYTFSQISRIVDRAKPELMRLDNVTAVTISTSAANPTERCISVDMDARNEVTEARIARILGPVPRQIIFGGPETLSLADAYRHKPEDR